MAACLRGAEWEDVSDNAVSLVKWLLEVDPAKRCSGVVQKWNGRPGGSMPDHHAINAPRPKAWGGPPTDFAVLRLRLAI